MNCDYKILVIKNNGETLTEVFTSGIKREEFYKEKKYDEGVIAFHFFIDYHTGEGFVFQWSK